MDSKNEESPRPRISLGLPGGEPTQLLDDDSDISVATLDQAVYWASIYGEIMVKETKVLARIERLMSTPAARSRREVEMDHLPAIAAELSRFQRRRAGWNYRVDQLRRADGFGTTS